MLPVFFYRMSARADGPHAAVDPERQVVFERAVDDSQAKNRARAHTKTQPKRAGRDRGALRRQVPYRALAPT